MLTRTSRKIQFVHYQYDLTMINMEVHIWKYCVHALPVCAPLKWYHKAEVQQCKCKNTLNFLKQVFQGFVLLCMTMKWSLLLPLSSHKVWSVNTIPFNHCRSLYSAVSSYVSGLIFLHNLPLLYFLFPNCPMSLLSPMSPSLPSLPSLPCILCLLSP